MENDFIRNIKKKSHFMKINILALMSILQHILWPTFLKLMRTNKLLFTAVNDEYDSEA